MKNSGFWFGAVVLVFMFCIFGAIIRDAAQDKASHPDAPIQNQHSEYAPQMKNLCDRFAEKGFSATWPSNENDAVMRIDLPALNGKMDNYTACKIAKDCYQGFVNTRSDAGVDNPENCLIHIYDNTGKQIAYASQDGAKN